MSGGQTGADRAALDFAINHGIPHGGWCPRGRTAEDGAIAARYELRETGSSGYVARTRQNVVDSDGTLIVNLGVLDGGSLATLQVAERLGRPCLVVQPDQTSPDVLAGQIRNWIDASGIKVLNVAGPRESKRPGIGKITYEVLERGFGTGAPPAT